MTSETKQSGIAQGRRAALHQDSMGTQFAENFRPDEPVPPLITALNRGSFAAARIRRTTPDQGIVEIEPQAAFVLAYVMEDFTNSELWVGERATKWDPIRAGGVHFYGLHEGLRANVRDPLNFVYLYFPNNLLDEFSEQYDLPKIGECGIPSGAAFSDAVTAHLALRLLPVFERPEEASQLFIDYVAFGLEAHFARQYAGICDPASFFRGGLSPARLRRAQDVMVANLSGDISVQDIAGECGLSRSHFFRAFKNTTGKTPHKWLIQSRVERSKELMRFSALSLAEIAVACGFSSHGHFTRVFSAVTGVAPSVWRKYSNGFK